MSLILSIYPSTFLVVSGRIIEMKKLFLLFCLIIISGCTAPVQTSIQNEKTGFTSGNKFIESYSNWTAWNEAYTKILKYSNTEIIVNTYDVFDQEASIIFDNENCFDFTSSSYFNINKCEEIEFSYSKEGSEDSLDLFIFEISEDICEKVGVILHEPGRGGSIDCTGKVLAEKEKRIAEEEERKIAIEKEKEIKAREYVDSKIKFCEEIGFKEKTIEMSKCVLELVIIEKQEQLIAKQEQINKKVSYYKKTSNEDLVKANQRQAAALEKQLQIQNNKEFEIMWKRFSNYRQGKCRSFLSSPWECD